MSKRSDSVWMADIAEAIKRIERYMTDIDDDQLLMDHKTQDAVIRNLEVIGEAARNISAEFKRKHKQVEWKNIAGMRDRLIHQYFGVNWEIILDVLRNKLPELKIQIQDLLSPSKP
jgi:uncharacterized protein with HEPN domain